MNDDDERANAKRTTPCFPELSRGRPPYLLPFSGRCIRAGIVAICHSKVIWCCPKGQGISFLVRPIHPRSTSCGPRPVAGVPYRLRRPALCNARPRGLLSFAAQATQRRRPFVSRHDRSQMGARSPRGSCCSFGCFPLVGGRANCHGGGCSRCAARALYFICFRISTRKSSKLKVM